MLSYNAPTKAWKSILETELNKKISFFLNQPSFSGVSDEVKKRILQFALAGGKRLRPHIFIIVNNAYKPMEQNIQMAAAAGIELFHLFALIHDDLVDGSPQRRGKPSLHELLKLKPGEAGVRDGRSLAIITGDLIFTEACRTFTNLAVTDSLKNRALKLLLEVAQTTGGGALSEIHLRDCPDCDSAITRKLHCYKTAEYSFSIPLALGGLLGSCEIEEEEKLFCLGRTLGRAYQIRDDLEDLEALLNGSDKSKEAPRDVFQNLPFVIGLETGRQKDFKNCWKNSSELFLFA
jgi:geranylgeranyl pyrophosphate synthase